MCAESGPLAESVIQLSVKLIGLLVKIAIKWRPVKFYIFHASITFVFTFFSGLKLSEIYPFYLIYLELFLSDNLSDF